MRLVRKVIGVLWKKFFLLNFVITMILLYPFFRILLSREQWYPKAFRLMRAWAHYLIYFNFLSFRIVRLAPLPKPPYIICANHTSYLDILLTYCAIPDYFVFMGKQELGKVPLFNVFFRKMNILVNRKSVTGSHRAFVRAAADVDKGHCIAIFPEGTISTKAPEMLPFKNGPFKLAMDKKIPIVPVTFNDNWDILQDAGFFTARAFPGKATIILHPAIETASLEASDLLTLKNQVFDIIKGGLSYGKG